jgi:hypothetical protein
MKMMLLGGAVLSVLAILVVVSKKRFVVSIQRKHRFSFEQNIKSKNDRNKSIRNNTGTLSSLLIEDYYEGSGSWGTCVRNEMILTETQFI